MKKPNKPNPYGTQFIFVFILTMIWVVYFHRARVAPIARMRQTLDEQECRKRGIPLDHCRQEMRKIRKLEGLP